MRLANRVIKSKKEVILEPMNSQERKIIHAELQGHPVVKTYSKGEEPNRRVVIAVNNLSRNDMSISHCFFFKMR